MSSSSDSSPHPSSSTSATNTLPHILEFENDYNEGAVHSQPVYVDVSAIKSTRSTVIRTRNRYDDATHENDMHFASETNVGVTAEATYANGAIHQQTMNLKEAREVKIENNATFGKGAKQSVKVTINAAQVVYASPPLVLGHAPPQIPIYDESPPPVIGEKYEAVSKDLDDNLGRAIGLFNNTAWERLAPEQDTNKR